MGIFPSLIDWHYAETASRLLEPTPFNPIIVVMKVYTCRMLGSDSKGSSGSQDSSGRQRRQTTKPLVKQPSDTSGGGGGGGGGSITGVRQDTGYSTESSDSRRSRTKKVNTETRPVQSGTLQLQNPFLAGVKSYSTSTGYEVRELEDLSEIPSEYRELQDISDSESEIR